jgi:predicted MFS family arabinose efflux permease
MEIDGWRSAWLIMGALILLGGLLATRLIVDAPERVGQAPDGEPAKSGPPPAAYGLRVREAIRTGPFLLTYAAAFIMSFPLYTPFVHLVPYARDRGIDGETALVLASLIGIGSILGRFVTGGIADRVGLRFAFMATFAGLTIAYALWLSAESVGLLTAFALLHGVCYGGFVALAPAVIVDYVGTKHASGVLGALYTCVGPGALLGAPLAGYAFDLWQSYTVPLIASAALMVLSTLIIFFLPDPARWRARRSGALTNP